MMAEYIEKIIPVLPGSQAAMAFEEYSELVRCRDCKYLDTPDWDEVLAAQYGEPPASCMRPDGNGDYMRFEVEPDGFCKWGERK